MNAIKILVKNLIILSLADRKITCDEITTICDVVTKTYWFLQDIITLKELKILMREYIVLYQKHDSKQLSLQFQTNTNLLKTLIPTNQKYEHVKILKKLAKNKTISKEEQDLIDIFEEKFLKFIEEEAVLLELSFEDYRKYLTVLMQYSFVDKVSINESYIIVSEIELYYRSKEIDDDPKDLYKELIKEVESNQHHHPGSRFIQNTKNLLLSFTNKQDKYFLKTLKQVKNADNKISTQEKSFDSLLLTSRHAVDSEKVKIDEALSNIVFNVHSPYSITEQDQENFIRFLTFDTIAENIVSALENMKYILLIYFEIDNIDEESLYKLFKKNQLSYQQLIFIKKLLYIFALKNKHIITHDEYIIIINKAASVSLHYYKEIPREKKEKYKHQFPIYDF